MKKKLLEDSEEITEPKKRIYITFTELYEKKQEWLESTLQEHGEVYVLSKRTPPLKITLAEFK